MLIASVTAISQFWPETDSLQVVVERKLPEQGGLKFQGKGLLRTNDNQLSPLFGPVSWKIRVFNSTDRLVSIVGYKLFQLSENDNLVQSNAFLERLRSFDHSMPEQNFPFHINAREAVPLVFSMMMPYAKEIDGSLKCSEASITIDDLEECLFKKGRDLFGNPVNVEFQDDSHTVVQTVHWNKTIFSPKFLLVFETASGQQFSARLSYSPF